MNESLNWFTILLNKWFGGAALSLLSALHITPGNPAYPIPNHVSMSIVVVLLAMVFFLWLRPRISAERPGATQQVMELVITNPMNVGIGDLLRENISHEPMHYLPMVGSISLFILFSNTISILPAFDAPTGAVSVPLGCAILTFLYYNVSGLKRLGALGYAKTFAGPVVWLSPLIFVVEIISNFARLLSLTVRLWANIFASELLYVIFLTLLMAPATHAGSKNAALGLVLGILPATIPVILILLHAFVAVVQAFVFTILPAVYIGMATSEHH